MPVTDVKHDLDTRTLTITAEFAAPAERIWQVYADPRQLEKIWNPPTYPATVVEHDLTPGGRVNYFMTSPEGEKFAGYWKVTAVDEPSIAQMAIDSGAYGYITKPFREGDVINTVAAVGHRRCVDIEQRAHIERLERRVQDLRAEDR